MSNAFPGAMSAPMHSPPSGVAAVDCGTVLLVDDEEGVRAVTSVLLRRRGYGVVEAADGHEALDQFTAAPSRYSALLVDLSMPHMDGAAFLAAVRSFDAHPPVVAMSGHERHDAIRLFGELPVDRYLQKPFSPERLFTVLEELRASSKALNSSEA